MPSLAGQHRIRMTSNRGLKKSNGGIHCKSSVPASSSFRAKDLSLSTSLNQEKPEPIRKRCADRDGHVFRRKSVQERRHVTFVAASAVEENNQWSADALLYGS
ncbi:MAG: hypothetical protein JWQ59_1662 [Cryobacterium sp.]|nr:hypothetical protein [Cryobacterium sp.]